MEKPIYKFEYASDGLWYEFESKNDDKIIRKAVAYYPAESSDVFQLVFGDLKESGEIDFFAVSNNKDMPTILATVIETLYVFFERNPSKTVIFKGSTDARTRLYRATIAKLFYQVSDVFEIRGLKDDDIIETFVPSHTYYAYIINKKNHE